MSRLLLACLFLCLVRQGAAGWGGNGKGWGQQQGRSDGHSNSGYQSSGRSYNSFGKGGWQGGATWEAGYLAALHESHKKRRHSKRVPSSSEATPESTPEKPKSKQWRKVKSELEELRNFKTKVEQAEVEKRQEQKMAELEQRLTSRLQAAQEKSLPSSSQATETHDGPTEDVPLNKVQQKLAARLLATSSDESDLLSWRKVEKYVEGMDSQDLHGSLRREGVSVPRNKKDRQNTLQQLLRTELGLDWIRTVLSTHLWLALGTAFLMGWAVGFCSARTTEISLPFPFSAATKYVCALFTVWKDELGLGKLIESMGVPITTAAGASLSWFAKMTVATLRWKQSFSSFHFKPKFLTRSWKVFEERWIFCKEQWNKIAFFLRPFGPRTYAKSMFSLKIKKTGRSRQTGGAYKNTPGHIDKRFA